MPTPSCRDALSREISDPVYDPFTGNCYRNPCAAEEAGVFAWEPGCAPAPLPVYGNYEVAPVVYGGDADADFDWRLGGGRRRRRGAGGGAGGGGGGSSGGGRTVNGRVRPGRTLLPGASSPSGGGVKLVDGPTQADGSRLALAPGGGLRLIGSGTQDTSSTLATTGGGARLVGGSSQAGGSRLAIAQPGSYVSAGPLQRAVTRTASPMQLVSRPSIYASATRAAPMQYVSRPSNRAMHGLGADPGAGGAFILFFVAAAGIAVVPAAVAGWITRRKTRSWSRTLAVTAGVAAVEVAAVVAYNQRFAQRLRAIQTIENNYSAAQTEAIRTHSPMPPRPAALEPQGTWTSFFAPLMPVPT